MRSLSILDAVLGEREHLFVYTWWDDHVNPFIYFANFYIDWEKFIKSGSYLFIHSNTSIEMIDNEDLIIPHYRWINPNSSPSTSNIFFHRALFLEMDLVDQ